jgi:DNA-directed RNA polymerase specialized sigma24 family protein
MSEFGCLVEEQIPSLRRYARALTHDGEQADDLVQNCLSRAFAKQHLWAHCSDLRVWLFKILRPTPIGTPGGMHRRCLHAHDDREPPAG